jgi:hypothetical protein
MEVIVFGAGSGAHRRREHIASAARNREAEETRAQDRAAGAAPLVVDQDVEFGVYR